MDFHVHGPVGEEARVTVDEVKVNVSTLPGRRRYGPGERADSS
jgi:hypothetical protein